MPIITNTTGRPRRIGRVTLAVGPNDVAAEDWAAIAQHPHVVADVEAAKAGGRGLVVEEEPVEAPPPKTKGKDKPAEPPAE